MKKLMTICVVLTIILTASNNANAFVETFDTNPVLSSTPAADTWYTDRSAPSEFVSEFFDGDNRLKVSIDGEAQPTDSFYQTQGRKYDTNLTGSVQTFSIDLYVGSDWDTQTRYTGIWGTGFDATNTVSAYPILAFRNAEGDTSGFYTYDYVNDGWLNQTLVTNFDEWYNLKFVLTVGTGVEYFVNGVSIGTFADADTISLGNVILNTKNYGEDYNVYYDNFTATAVPEPATLCLLGLGGLLLRKRRA